MTAGKDSPAVAPWRPSTTSLLMCAPDHYEVAFAINPHMTDAEGRLHAVDRELARRQWDDLRKEFESIGYAVDVLPGEPGFPDMTFAANQTFCFRRTDGTRVALIARMAHPERAGEPPFFARRFAERGYEILELPSGLGPLEGAGDLVWHPTRRTLYCGYGFRSTLEAGLEAARLAEAEAVPLRLVDPRFYHLDTALAPLDDRVALVAKAAFEPAGLAALAACFVELVEAPEDEAAALFACNAFCPDGRNVLIDSGCVATRRLLADRGYRVRPTDTSEFRKGGGSVFCLKAACD